MGFNRGDVEERINERAEEVEERLENIPRGYTMPDSGDMTIGSAKRLRLGIVFIDISGFTEYTSSNHPEDVLFMLNVFIPEVMELVRDFSGYFEKNTGDGILAYFGAGDDDDEIAKDILAYIASVRTALDDYVNPILEEKDIEEISIKAGASLGTTHISRIGVHSLNRRTAVGSSANVASNLQDKASSEEYFVNHGVYKGIVEGDTGWEEYLDDQGRHGLRRWGSESSGWEPAHYYNFTGSWN
jgi:class 3 adenylate cyclase